MHHFDNVDRHDPAAPSVADSSRDRGYFQCHVRAQFSPKWVRYDSQFVYSQLRYIDRILDLGSLNDKPVLEIGSGMGRLALLLRERGFLRYTGLEVDADAAAFAREHFSSDGYQFVHGALEEFASGENVGQYSGIFCFETLEHLSAPLECVGKIHTLLSRNGVFVGTTPYPFRRNIDSDETHVSVLHPLNWKRLFEQTGFSVVALKPMTFVPYLWRLHRRLNRRLNLIMPVFVPMLPLVSTALIVARKHED